MKKNTYTLKELIENKSFQRIVKGNATIEEIKEWDQWIEASSQNRRLAKKAMENISGVDFKDFNAPDLHEEWEKISSRTIEKRGTPKLGTPNSKNQAQFIKKMMGIAASLLLASLISVAFYLTTNPTELKQSASKIDEISTGPKENKTVKLSDGSTITLNANSSMTYTDGWRQGEPIKVSLQGQAFFHVIKRTSPDQPEFQVNTPDGIIYDMGTKFVVTVQKEHSSVVLQEGWVHVETESETSIKKSADVHAGEMLEFNKTDVFQKKKVNPSFYSSWATGSIHFDDTDVRELAQHIEREFNVTVVIGSDEVAKKVIEGAIHYRSLEDLMRSVSGILKVSVYRSAKRDTIFISKQYN